MTTISIKSTFYDLHNVSVKIDGECNHDGAEEDHLEFQTAIDDSEMSPVMLCTCGAYRVGYLEEDENGVGTAFESEWHND